MSFLLNLFKRKPVAPERVPTDEVIPLHHLDDTSVNRAICLYFSMRFDDVLDPDKLVGALEKLLERPGWRKLGARLRLNEHKKLEYHVPQKYSPARPAVQYTHASHHIPISEHPLGSKMPKATSKLSISGALEPFRELFWPQSKPLKLADWLYSDRPQLQLHIVSFSDTTLVTLTWLHTLLDAMGRNMLLRCWSAMLEGREDDIPEFYGYDFDPLASLGAPKTSTESKPTADDDESEHVSLEQEPGEEPYVLQDKVLTGWSFFSFVIRFIWDLTVHRAEHSRILCIPASFLSSLRRSALSDLSTVHPSTLVLNTSDPANPTPFLSDGDILAAWWLRTLVPSQPWASTASPNKTIHFMNVFGMRDILTSTSPQLLPKGVAYISNCVSAIHTLFTYSDILTKPLGLLAAQIRIDLTQQSTRAQVEAQVRLSRKSIAKSNRPPIYGTGDMQMSTVSNWSKGKMYETDFKAAVVGGHENKSRRGKPSFVQADGLADGFSVRNSGCVLGRDGEGNYWVTAVLRPVVWEGVERAIRSMA
ncbi:hypothetical protein BCR34DRAFT_537431 [Clohesyomyces aquaticus]|uniref:Transferase family-domain-containing protein n=1 Tax=Clohesyomyces aquaticus TaxID=1231657 RepID=A0A1Y1ZP18_9PLEO|nr:hypothetical protein BCR34DRAFT_537431 [Clohesyomyces aquaticus]